MDFDFTTETITPDSTTLLTVGGTGGLEVPVGTTVQRPVTGLVNGTLRYNTDLNVLEGYINNSWASQSGSVTSVAITGSTGLSVSGSPITSSGTITLTNTGVTSAIGTSGNITVSGATGAVMFNLAVAGTAATYGSVTTDTFGRVTSGNVTTPISNGGTALSTTPTNGQLLIGNGTNYTLSALTAGTGISVTNGSGSITIANTGVTSVALSLPSIFTVSGPPVTTTGTLTGTLASQTANTVFSAPNGSSGTPTFRTLALTDLSSAIQLYRENPSSPTTPLVAGTNAVAIGTGSSASATQGIAIGTGSSANVFGIRAYANGSTATAGDAQAIDALLRNTTTNTTTTELFLDGTAATQRLVLSNNSAWTFSAKIVARRTDATGSLGSWIFTGLIYRDASTGTTTLSGISKTTIARIGSIVSANDPVVTADATNGSLKISVTGVTSQTYRWVADIELVQVTN